MTSSSPGLVTPFTELVGIDWPIVQAGMSWASSSAQLPLAVSRAGGLGVIAAGPMRLDALREAIRTVREGTDSPFAVNIPLYRSQSAECLDLAETEGVPVIIASQGGPRGNVERFHDAGRQWLHVVASVEHAVKAEAAGVDGVVAVGVEAGGHPAPSEVTTMVLVRAVARAVSIPVVAAGGIADGAGIAAALALGASAAQLGTRFLLTPESSVHDRYRHRVLDTAIDGTTLLGRGGMPVRVVRNEMTDRAGEGEPVDSTLKQAALDGDIDAGKVEAGQSAGLVDSVEPAADVMATLVSDLLAELARLGALGVSR